MLAVQRDLSHSKEGKALGRVLEFLLSLFLDS